MGTRKGRGLQRDRRKVRNNVETHSTDIIFTVYTQWKIVGTLQLSRSRCISDSGTSSRLHGWVCHVPGTDAMLANSPYLNVLAVFTVYTSRS